MARPRKNENTPLTRKMERFVKEFVTNDGFLTKRECAIKAGYSKSSAHVKAYELTNPDLNPHVVAFMNKYKAEVDEKYGVSYGRHIRDLQKIRDEALEAGAFSAAVQAEKARGLAQGNIYVNKSEIRHGSIDSMSREEVEKELQKIRDTYGTPIINVTPEKEKPKQVTKESRKSILSGLKIKPKKVKKKVTLN
jgi:phage terminase small subunit